MTSPAAQVTWEDIFTLVQEARDAAGASRLNISSYRVHAWQRLAEVFRATKAYETSWDNASGGDLTLTTYIAPLPVDCLLVTRVEWDGSDTPLEIVSEEDLDYDEPGWRDETGGDPTKCVITGRRLLLNTTPDSPVTGKLVVRGYGVPSDSDILSYLPVDGPRHLATGILSLCPWRTDNQGEIALKQQATQEWNLVGLPALSAGVMARRTRPFWY